MCHPIGRLVCHHGRFRVKGLGRTSGSKRAGLKEARDVDKKDAENICAKRPLPGDEPHSVNISQEGISLITCPPKKHLQPLPAVCTANAGSYRCVPFLHRTNAWLAQGVRTLAALEHCGHLLTKEINEACKELTPHLFRAQRISRHQLRVTLMRPHTHPSPLGKHPSFTHCESVGGGGGWAARNSKLKAALTAQQPGRGPRFSAGKTIPAGQCDTYKNTPCESQSLQLKTASIA